MQPDTTAPLPIDSLAETVLTPPPGGDRSAPATPGAAGDAPVGVSLPDARYRLEEEVGRGGMGRVLRARDQVLLREVALKLVAGRHKQDEERFCSEAQITGQLDHPNVLPVYDLGHDAQGRPYFTMKLVRGHASLGDVIDRLRAGDPATARRFSFERRVQVIQAVCHALRYAHERGVVHRDIKPQNVVLGACGEVYLVDWGVAHVGETSGGAPVDPGPGARATPGEVTGTPAYMAPEQLIEGRTDALTDLYSLCAVLYELLTLQYYLGHVGDGLPALGLALRDRVPQPAERHRDPREGRVPRVLSRICEKGLAKAREERFQSAQELEEALQRWFEGTAPIVCPGTCMQRVLSRWSYLVDQRPFLIPVVSLLLGALFMGAALSTFLRTVRMFLY